MPKIIKNGIEYGGSSSTGITEEQITEWGFVKSVNNTEPVNGNVTIDTNFVKTVNNVAPINGNITVDTNFIKTINGESPVNGNITIDTNFVKTVNSVSPIDGNVVLNIPAVTDTYSSSSTSAMSGKAVASAISALDGNISGSAGSGKTLTSFSQTDGKVTATFGNISITKSQISDFPTIPAAVTETTVGNWGFIKNNTIELTRAQYNALSSPDPDIIYFITDGTSYQDGEEVLF